MPFVGLLCGIVFAFWRVGRDKRATRLAIAAIDTATLLTCSDAVMDGELGEKLADSTVRLVRATWLLSEVCPAKMPRLQELPPEALFPPDEAYALLRRGDRSMISLSHGWLTADHPDPAGETLATLKQHLRSLPASRLPTSGVFGV